MFIHVCKTAFTADDVVAGRSEYLYIMQKKTLTHSEYMHGFFCCCCPCLQLKSIQLRSSAIKIKLNFVHKIEVAYRVFTSFDAI